MVGTYVVRTFGCQMNEHDSERIAGLLEADGYRLADDVGAADVVVLNTCCIRENADNKLYSQLGRLKTLKDERPDMRIVVSGCLAQKDRELVRERAPYVDVVLGTHNVGRAAELLRQSAESGPVTEIVDSLEEFPSALPVQREAAWAAWVTIQVGCDNDCAFCIVPAVRGPEVSRPFGDVLDEVQRAIADGVSEVTLLGQNVNSYGRDLALAKRAADDRDVYSCGQAWATAETLRARPLFSDLLRAVGALPGLRRVRYTSPHPKDLRPETIAAMAEVPTVCEHLHYPLQSGSNRILAAMHRGYTAERYLERLRDARSIIDDLAVTTDIIVGFPGETDTDFAHTLEVAATAEFDSAYLFEFSPRQGTQAAEFTDEFVAHDVVRDRFDRLKIVVERSALANQQARIGLTEEIIVEGASRRDPSRVSGRTRQNRLVHVPVAAGLVEGALASVLITHAAPHHMLGELVEVLEAPRRRRRIPVSSS